MIASYNSGHKDILTEQNSLMLSEMRPVTITTHDQATAVWDEPSLDETIERLEFAYLNRDSLKAVQRIRGRQHEARLAGRDLADGDVVTACQQTCPAEAIVFGNGTDPASRVAQKAADPRGYHVLHGLKTKSAVTYLLKVRHTGEA